LQAQARPGVRPSHRSTSNPRYFVDCLFRESHYLDAVRIIDNLEELLAKWTPTQSADRQQSHNRPMRAYLIPDATIPITSFDVENGSRRMLTDDMTRFARPSNIAGLCHGCEQGARTGARWRPKSISPVVIPSTSNEQMRDTTPSGREPEIDVSVLLFEGWETQYSPTRLASHPFFFFFFPRRGERKYGTGHWGRIRVLCPLWHHGFMQKVELSQTARMIQVRVVRAHPRAGRPGPYES